MSTLPKDIARDVEIVSEIDAVRTVLQVMRRTLGLRLTLVARVTDESWTACAVLDETEIGLKPGDQLELATTF